MEVNSLVSLREDGDFVTLWFKMRATEQKLTDLESEISNKKKIIEACKVNKEIVVMQMQIDLERKYKETKDLELSNAEKRQARINNDEAVKEYQDQLDIVSEECRKLELEHKHLERLFRIELKEAGESTILLRIATALETIAKNGLPK